MMAATMPATIAAMMAGVNANGVDVLAACDARPGVEELKFAEKPSVTKATVQILR
jgi:hypothetical protein